MIAAHERPATKEEWEHHRKGEWVWEPIVEHRVGREGNESFVFDLDPLIK